VEVEDNPQLMLYAALLLFDSGRQDAFSKVFLHVVQRDLANPGNPVERVAEVAPDTLYAWWDGPVRAAMDEAASPAPVPVANLSEQCRWCPGKAVCPAWKDAVGEAVSLAEEEASAIACLTDFGPLLARLRSLVEVHKQVAELAKEALLAGAPCSGFKLVAGRARRGWKPGAESAAVSLFGMAALTEPELRSPAQVEKLALGRAFTAEWAVPGEGPPVLVADSDRREAVQSPRAAEAMFPVQTERNEDAHRSS